MNKMGPLFMDDDNSVHGDTIDTENQSLISSGFRDVALSSLIPQVASELLGMEFNPNENRNDVHDGHGHGHGHGRNSDDEVNLRMLRYVITTFNFCVQYSNSESF